MRLPTNATRKMNRDLTKFILTNQTDENSIFNAAHAAAEIPLTIGLLPLRPCMESDKVQKCSPLSPDSSTDDEKEMYARHFSNQKLRAGSKIGIVRTQNRAACASKLNATWEQNMGAEALLALSNRGKETTGFLPPRHVAITIKRHAVTSPATMLAVAEILRQALKDLKSMDKKQYNVVQAVQTYEATSDRLLHCLRLQCLSAAHTKLAILSLDRCCKQWLMALKFVDSRLPSEEVARQHEKAHLCRREGQALLHA
jgi:hypothetical protein